MTKNVIRSSNPAWPSSLSGRYLKIEYLILEKKDLTLIRKIYLLINRKKSTTSSTQCSGKVAKAGTGGSSGSLQKRGRDYEHVACKNFVLSPFLFCIRKTGEPHSEEEIKLGGVVQ